MAIELIAPAERAYRLKVIKASQPGNKTLNRVVSRNGRAVVNRLGYQTICACYSQQTEIGRLSGSSLNRAHAKKVRHEQQIENERMEKIQEKICGADSEWRKWKRSIEILREAAHCKPKYKGKFSELEDRSRKPVHLLSQRTKGKVRDKCTAFHRCLGTRKTFATLTFLNDVSDKKAVAVLNAFFNELRAQFGKRLKYIWIAERQTKTTNRIHFHIILNQFLPVRKFNSLWVRQQYNAGIEHPDYSYADINNFVDEGRLQKHLNPFDVKPIRNIHGLSYYLTKYVTKNDSGAFDCLAWHCSRSVSKLFTKTVVPRSTFRAAGSFSNATLDKRTGEVKKHKGIGSAFYQLFYIENKPYFLPEMAELEQVNRWIVDGMKIDTIPIIDDDGILKFYSN